MKKTALLLFVLCLRAFALQGGAVQPDYVQFAPSGLKDMVDLSTGDFVYQIPLGEVPGPYGNYPLSLSYRAGISPQQEASWVGLGWSLNPGVINREVRGVPDDQFHGGTLGFIYQYASMQTWGVELGFSNGVFSVGQTFSSNGSVGFSATVGPKIAGLGGVGFTVGSEAVGVTASVGLNSAASLKFGVSASTRDGRASVSLGASLSAAGASLGAQVSSGGRVSGGVGFGRGERSFGMIVSSNGVSMSVSDRGSRLSAGSGGVGFSVGGSGLAVSNSSSRGTNKSATAGFAVVVPTYVGVFSSAFSQSTYEYWMRSATSEYIYGYMYQAGPSIDVGDTNEFHGLPDADIAAKRAQGASIPWKWTIKGRTLESMGDEDMSPAYDIYSVSSEGGGGAFRPFAREKHRLYKKFSNEKTDGFGSVESYSTILEDCEDDWPCPDDFKKDSAGELVPTGSAAYEDYAHCLRSNGECSVYGMYQTNYRNNGNRLVFNSKDGTEERGGMQFLFVGEGGGYFESDDAGENRGRPRNSASPRLLRRRIGNFEYALYGARRIEPLFEDGSPVGKLAGFVITNADGTRYYFQQPVRSYLKVDYSINRDKGVPLFSDRSSSKYENFWENLWDGVVAFHKWGVEHTLNPFANVKDVYNILFRSGHLEETCIAGDEGWTKDYFFSYAVNMNPYATQWLLTEIRGADYVKIGDREIGYHVKFAYTEPALYRWRTPYARPDLEASLLPNFRSPRNAFTPEGCDSRKYQASFGIKEYVYLKSIETASHRVDFELNVGERVDGKGWETLDSEIPILVQASLGWKIESRGTETQEEFRKPGGQGAADSCSVPVQRMTVLPQYLYFNSPVPQKFLESLYADRKIRVHGLQRNQSLTYAKILGFKNDKLGTVLHFSGPTDYEIEPGSYGRTSGEESRLGLYRLKLKAEPVNVKFYFLEDSLKSRLQTLDEVVLGENGDLDQNPYIDWADVAFSNSALSDYDNQMRYLFGISYYRKGQAEAYREYAFDYDYSLQPRTLNSYCKGRYPAADSIRQVVESPDSAGIGVCENAGRPALFGKLALRSLTERGCRDGKCYSLPPFRFSYNSPSASPTRISTPEGWMDYFQGNVSNDDSTVADMYGPDYFENFSDLDATILASTNTTDEYGFWSHGANVENRKVDQDFADYGAAAWSLNKVTDPAGGELEIEYERDRLGRSLDYAQEKKTAEFFDFGECKSFGVDDSLDASGLCIKVKPLYWREQCLGPRAAYWDKERPRGFNGNGFEYLDSLGVKSGNGVFFNLMAQVGTKVKCGLFGVGRCSRTRSVALVGDGNLRREIDSPADTSRILVLDREWNDVWAGLLKAAKKINKKQKWALKDNDARNGYLWGVSEIPEYRVGDLRVKRLTRHDMGVHSRTDYWYADGEMTQLADSSYTSVLGSRFYTNKISTALPGLHLPPVSRIVGFNDDDLMLLPGAKVLYPTVTVSNSSEDGSAKNGTSEFFYITPETGIPRGYVDAETRKVLKPFIKVNLLHTSLSSDPDNNKGRIVRVSLLDSAKNPVPSLESRTVILFPDQLLPLFFYSGTISETGYVKHVKVETMASDGHFVPAKSLCTLDSVQAFNELSLSLVTPKDVDDTSAVDLLWFRSQKKNFYPILYRQVAYASMPIDLDAASDGDYSLKNCDVDFESSVTYHDLTAFLGRNYKTVFRRGGDGGVVVKMDSSVFSTVVPDVADVQAEGVEGALYKVGRQVEKWSSENRLQCVDKSGNPDLQGKGKVCKKQKMDLFMRQSAGSEARKEFAHIRYPVFQVGSVSYAGYDNQPSSGRFLWQESKLENHLYDPITGNPTATLARTPLGAGKEMRKLSLNAPHYGIAHGDTAVSRGMFLRRMLAQNFLSALYSGDVDSASPWNSIRMNDSLRSFEIFPFRFLPDSLYPNGERPLVGWGSFKSRREPREILAGKGLLETTAPFQSTDPASGQDFPPVESYAGARIDQVDGRYRVREIRDAFGRTTSSHYSYDGMYQTGIFFPAGLSEVASIVPYGDTIAMTNCGIESLGYRVTEGAFIRFDGIAHVRCYAKSPSDKPLVAEYAFRKSGRSWETHRDTVRSFPYELTFYGGYLLSYLRVYPADGEAKTFVYDRYGSLVRLVSERNLSSSYEYDPLGNLVQVRDDDGNSFKAHHREYLNDGGDTLLVVPGGGR
ncbi:MAG: RHS repeat domain-containing protein [Fibrobacter intestinalis]|uniref:RHS repeat domain-containing protein n=1 Tax=Fibrobacter intestinalis TaxID=28122 RepID=UPI003EFDDE93